MRLTLIHLRAPGDTLAGLEPAVQNLHLAYPGKYSTSVQCGGKSIFDNHPFVSRDRGKPLFLDWHNYIHTTDLSYAQIFCKELERHLKNEVPCVVNRPTIYLSDKEKEPITDLPPRYIVLNAGWKHDCTTKYYPLWQAVVDAMPLPVVQIGAAKDRHPKLHGVIDYIGKTSIRQLFTVAYNSVMGMGGITFLHHIYGALQKPYVCVAGGRERPSLIPYGTQIHGQCEFSPCWSLLVKGKVNVGNSIYKPNCLNPCGEWAGCLSSISPTTVINTVCRTL